MFRIARRMALQARRAFAREQLPRHGPLRIAHHLHLGRDIRRRLRGHGGEETHQFLDFAVREVKSWHAGFEILSHAVAVGIGSAQRRVREKAHQPGRIDARAFANEAGRLLVLPIGVLITRQRHEHRGLSHVHLMAAHAVVFADHPPAIDDVLPLVDGLVMIALRHSGIDRAQQKRRHLVDLRLGQIEIRHLQPVELVRLLFALIVDRRIFQLVLEEALVRVPALALGFVTQ